MRLLEVLLDTRNRKLKHLKKITTEEELASLGYKRRGKLCELPLFKRRGVFDRLWYWEKDTAGPVVSLDEGNGYCSMVDWGDIYKIDREAWLERRRANYGKLFRRN